MSKELTISNLDQHLKPVQIDGVSTPLELSTTDIRISSGEFSIDNLTAETAKVGGDLTLVGDLTLGGDIWMTEYIRFPDSVTIYSNSAGLLSCNADTLLLSTVQHGGTNSAIALASATGYDSQINFMESVSTKWHLGNDADDSHTFKIGTGAAMGSATKLDLDTSGNLTVAGEFVSSNMLYGSGVHQFYGSGGSASHFFGIAVAANAVTSLSTNSTSTDASDFTIDANGDIALDSSTGVFIAKKAGTEFSAANSAYAGMILGYTCIGLDEAAATYNLTTSYAVPTDEFSVSFTAPPSGNVEIEIQIGMDVGSSNFGDLFAGLSSANATSGYSQLADFHESELFDGMSRGALRIIRHSWTLTGLTAGTAYEFWAGFKSSSTTGTPHLQWGGNSSGGYPDFIMKATALPATITT